MAIEGVAAEAVGATTVIFYAGLLSILFTVLFFSFKSVRRSFDFVPEGEADKEEGETKG